MGCRFLRAIAFALAAGLAACAPSMDGPPPHACMIGAPAQEARMFFGRNVPGRAPVSDAAWQAFVDQVVTPQFPDGFTVLDGNGQWRGPAGIVAEPSKLVIAIVSRNAPLRPRIEAVSAAYRARFDQRSVGVVVYETCAAF